MAEQKQGSTALVVQPKADELAATFTGVELRTPQQLMECVRAVQEQAFVIGPMMVGAIAPGYTIIPVPVVIDPSVDPKSGKGRDIYHQRSIHKGTGRGDNYQPIEGSLNAYSLLNILSGAGVNVHPTRWLQDGVREPYLWVCETDGDMIDFTGQLRLLPTGIGSVDARDGSADIGEWTPEKWVEAQRIADAQRKKTPEQDQWKIKAEVNGWTAERVMQVRKYGRQLAKTKSINGLARKLGVRQSYTIEELRQRPFLILRALFQPDMSDPEIRRMITAAHLGSRDLLYPGASPSQRQAIPIADEPRSHAHGEPAIEGSVVPEEQERMETAAAPDDAEDVSFEDPKPEPDRHSAADIFHVAKITQRGKGPQAEWYIATKEGVTLYTREEAIMTALRAAGKDQQPREVPTERVVVGEKPYRQVVEVMAVGGLKL